MRRASVNSVHLSVILGLALVVSLLATPGASAAQEDPGPASAYQIVGGQPADVAEYPAMAAIIDSGFGQFCGGTLVDPGWVLTAAHCFFDSRTGGSSLAPDQVSVAMDTLDWTQGGERLGVSQIVLHPEYDDLRLINDIALLRLASPATTPPATLPAADQGSLYTAPQTVTATGWGGTNPFGENPSQILLEVDMPLVDDAPCDAAYDDGLFADRHVCAGDPGTEENPGPDSCQGDSGGPLWVDDAQGIRRIIGVTSFGDLCGVAIPGVYTEVITYLGWIGGIISGDLAPEDPADPTTPDLPGDGDVVPDRIVFDDPAVSVAETQAVAISQATFPTDGSLDFGVIATAEVFPDALGGAALAYGLGPLLFPGADGLLGAPARNELRRLLRPGATVYVLGGSAAVSPEVDAQLTSLGFAVVRLAGAGREETAALVADEVVSLFGELPFNTVVVATGGNWPDAVTVGQIGSRFGIPVLLTPTNALNADTAAALERYAPQRVLIAGGTAAVGDDVVAQIQQLTGVTPERLAGDTRFGTASAIADFARSDLYGPTTPSYVVAVNLRRPDAFAHVLAASMLTGQFGGVMAAVEGDDGSVLPDEVRDSICGLNVPLLVAGGTDLISDASVEAIVAALDGVSCDTAVTIQPGSLVASSVSVAAPVRIFRFEGVAGQRIRIQMDAFFGEEFDPVINLTGPGGFEAADDDGGFGFSSRLDVELPTTGTYEVAASDFFGGTGRFRLSVDAGLVLDDAGTLSAAQPTSTYPISAPPGTRVVVEQRQASAETDPLVRLLDGGTEIAADDDGAGFPNSRLDFVMPESGTVTIEAGVFGDDYGEYTLAVFLPEGGDLSFG